MEGTCSSLVAMNSPFPNTYKPGDTAYMRNGRKVQVLDWLVNDAKLLKYKVQPFSISNPPTETLWVTKLFTHQEIGISCTRRIRQAYKEMAEHEQDLSYVDWDLIPSLSHSDIFASIDECDDLITEMEFVLVRISGPSHAN